MTDVSPFRSTVIEVVRQGPAGPAIGDWRGTWVAGTYRRRSLVEKDGSTWLARRDTSGVPGVSADWDLIVSPPDATEAAVDARDAALVALAATEGARDDAQTAQAGAETAQGIAEDARDAALEARDDAFQAIVHPGVYYDTLSELEADLAHPDGTMGVVDDDGAASGIYRKSGASGSGSWVKKSDDTIQGSAARVAAIRSDLSSTSDPEKGTDLIGFKYPAPATLGRSLKEKLLDGGASIRDWGVDVAVSASQRTSRFQQAIDDIYDAGGGDLIIPPYSDLTLGYSSLSETYDNYGAPWEASWGCLVLRAGISLKGASSHVCAIRSEEMGALHVLQMVSPDRNTVSGLDIDGRWVDEGAGHGIIQLQMAGQEWCRRVNLEDLYIHDCASYGIGLENGDLEDVTLDRIRIFNVGADAIDFKQRGPNQLNKGVSAKRLYIEDFGMRLTGCAGVDSHGTIQIDGVAIPNFGVAGHGLTGIRLRTFDVPGSEGEDARHSSVTNFKVKSNALGDRIGVLVGSNDCHVGFGSIIGTTDGLTHQGNENGTPARLTASNIDIVGTSQYGVMAGGSGGTYVQVNVIGGNVGFRNEWTGNRFILCDAQTCTTPLSTAAVAAASQITLGCSFGGNGFREGSSTNRTILEPVGPGTDLWMLLSGKGAGGGALAATSSTSPANGSVNFGITADNLGVYTRFRGLDGVARSGPSMYLGSGSPEGVVSADRGSIFLRNNGGAATTFYVKESGTGTNTGWVAK